MANYLTKLYYAALTASLLVSCSSEKPAVKTEKTPAKLVLDPIIKQKPKPLPKTSLDIIVDQSLNSNTSISPHPDEIQSLHPINSHFYHLYGPIFHNLHAPINLAYSSFNPTYYPFGFSSSSYLDMGQNIFSQRLRDNCVLESLEENRRLGYPSNEMLEDAILIHCEKERALFFPLGYRPLIMERLGQLGYGQKIPLPDTSPIKNKKKNRIYKK